VAVRPVRSFILAWFRFFAHDFRGNVCTAKLVTFNIPESWGPRSENRNDCRAETQTSSGR
jgi:hypothetical protein